MSERVACGDDGVGISPLRHSTLQLTSLLTCQTTFVKSGRCAAKVLNQFPILGDQFTTII
jgi:hypothetical protein